MRTHPLSTGIFHIIGIGGIGMSGIAEVLHQLGHTVQGSDQSENANVERLRKQGITVFIGQKAENVKNATTIICSSAIKKSNPEVAAAHKSKLPVISRAEMLREIMRYKSTVSITGTHGKTSTTSLMATLLLHAKLDPTILNGGILTDIKSNARVGKGDWMVVEADESDKTFIEIPTTIGVITNIEPEHMENYDNSFKVLKEAFIKFANDVPFYGFSIVCLDHPNVKEILPHITRPYITYGTEAKADCRATNVKASPDGMRFDVSFEGHTLKDVHIPLHGIHNVLNTLSVIVVGYKLNLSDKVIKESLASFAGVKRRFTKTGEVHGVTIIDDYGHHPTEIAAVLKAAKQVTPHRVIAIVQPHKYTRLQNLFKEFSACFSDADELILAPVFEAGESPIDGINHKTLAAAAQKHFKGPIHAIMSEDELPALLQKSAKKGDYIICLGAGTISKWAYDLPKKLEPLLG